MQKLKSITKFVVIIFLALFFLNSCEKEDNRKQEEIEKLQQFLLDNGYTFLEPTGSGIYHVVMAEGYGESPKSADYISISYTSSLVDGTIFQTSNRAIAIANGIEVDDFLYGPARLLLGNIGIIGLQEGLMLMKEGGESRIIVPSELGYGAADYDIIPPYSTLVYDIELHRVISDPVTHEQELLDRYILDNEIDVSPTETGLYFIETQMGIGDEYPEDYSTVSIHYTGYLLDGRVFDTTELGDDAEPAVFSLVPYELVPGFVEGLKMMKKGGEARLIIPWDIAYGKDGSIDGIIPPYTTIVFDIQLIDFN